MSESIRFPIWWAGWWCLMRFVGVYHCGGWERVASNALADAITLGTAWLLWRGYRWVAARWKIVRVAA